MRIVIIGGGAAGFMAALTAAECSPNAEILLLEKNRTVLNKVRISGGGRCNVTHACFNNRLMAKNYPRGEKFLNKLLPHFDAQDTVAWFAARGVVLKTEPDGRMFPVSDSSETIIACLLSQARTHGIQIKTSTTVDSFSYSADTPGFMLTLHSGEVVSADRVLIATGGYPKRSGFDWLAEHAHKIEDPLPSLFTFNSPASYLLPLAGVSVQDVTIKINGSALEYRGPLLITHWGFSGPAILKLSAWGARLLAGLKYEFSIKINWLPGLNEDEVRLALTGLKSSISKQKITSHGQFGLPMRLWRSFLEQVEIPDELRWVDISNKALNRLVNLLTNSQFPIKGKSTFKEEFVTAGGIALTEINPATLESKYIRGLFFAGEVLDVDGITGGFNFQNAWTTGYIAGKMMSKTDE